MAKDFAESFRSFNHSSSDEGLEFIPNHKTSKKHVRSHSHSSNSGYSYSERGMRKSKNKKHSISIQAGNNPSRIQNQANHSMSFGGDSDGSAHKNSDEDELLIKTDKS